MNRFQYLALFVLLFCTFAVQDAFAQKVKVGSVALQGNKITKEVVILRELPFSIGDSVDLADLPQLMALAKENVYNLSLFNFVDVTSVVDSTQNQEVQIRLDLAERWYIWPVIEAHIEERNLSTWMQTFDFKKITIEAGVRINNCFGLKHKLILTAQGGYQWGLFVGYRDIALGTDRKHYLGLDVSAYTSHNIDAFTAEDKPVRFNIPDINLEEKLQTRINYTYRRSIRESHNLTFSHTATVLADTVLKLNPNYWGGNKTTRNAFRLNYWYLMDQRDYHKYPLNGYYIKAGINSYIAANEPVRYIQATLGLQYFKKFTDRWMASTVLNAGYSISNTQAYILDHAIGYGSAQLRGYEYTVADGQSHVTSNNTLKFNLLKEKIYTLNWLSWLPKFNKVPIAIYLNAHWDMGYANNKWYHADNLLSNQFLYAYGAGIDIVTYYDMVLGVDYARNKQGRSGCYFSIKVPFL